MRAAASHRPCIFQVGRQCVEQASAMLNQAAPQDPSGELAAAAAALAAPGGARAFLLFRLTAEENRQATGILQAQPGDMYGKVMASNADALKGAAAYVEFVTLDIAPYYRHQLKKYGKQAAKPPSTEPFEPLWAGIFAPGGVADPAKLQNFEQFNVFRRGIRADMKKLPQLLEMCKTNPGLKSMG